MTLWQFPESWINDEIRQFEQNEIKKINDNLAMLKMQKTLGDDSSDDSLCGWDIRP